MKKLEESLKDKKVLNLLGIAVAARKIILGQGILDSIRANEVRYLFIANDASENTQKKYCDKCNYYKVKYCNKYTSLELSSAIGQSGKMAVGIKDSGFAKKFRGLIEGGQYGKIE